MHLVDSLGHSVQAVVAARWARRRFLAGSTGLSWAAFFGDLASRAQSGDALLEAQLSSQVHLDSPVVNFRHLAQPAVEEVKSLLAADNVDAALSLAGDVLAFARQIGSERGGTVVGALVSHSLEASALRTLPPDVEMGESTLAVKERIAEMKARSQMISKAVSAAPWHMQRFDEPGLSLFRQIRESRGELEAIRWAETSHGPASLKAHP